MKEDAQISSSMKYINLEGLSKEQIIDKYEQLLFQREKHYKELVLQMGETNQKYIEVQDKVDELSAVNESLKKDIDKTDKLIEQEQISKDIWFIKLNNLIKDYDNMKEKINHRLNVLSSLVSKVFEDYASNLMSFENYQFLLNKY